MYEVFLFRLLGVLVWVFVACISKPLYLRGQKVQGNVYMVLSLVGLSSMALCPWDTKSPIYFDGNLEKNKEVNTAPDVEGLVVKKPFKLGSVYLELDGAKEPPQPIQPASFVSQ